MSPSTSSGAEPAPHRLSRVFGRAVRQHRVALGLSQKDLALAIGVGERFVVDLEAGKPTCQMGKAFAAARAVGLDIATFVEQPQDAPPALEEDPGYDLPPIPSPRKAP